MFPVQVPPLRERKEDIRLLVEYFIDRYSDKLGKKISSIDKKSLALLQVLPCGRGVLGTSERHRALGDGVRNR